MEIFVTKKLERVIGHERGDDGIKCITLYEDVAFVDQYIPEPSTIVSTAVIGLVAASSPPYSQYNQTSYKKYRKETDKEER